MHASLPYDETVFLWTPDEGFGFYEIGDIVENERPARAVAFDPKTLRVSTHHVTDYIINPIKRIYRVTLESGREVLVTKDHNLFTLDANGGVTRIASENAEGSHVMVPGTLPRSPTEESALDLLSLFEGDDEIIVYASDGMGDVAWTDDVASPSRRHYDSRDAAPLSCISSATAPKKADVAFKQSDYRLPRDLELTPEFGWVLGFYIAEGSARRKQVQFGNKDEALLDRVEEWFEGYDASIYRRKGDTGVERLTVCSALWSKIIRELAGSGSEKDIPDRAWNWPDEVLRELHEGLLDGDGSRRESRDTLYTSNGSLASGAMYLAARLGLHSSTYSRERETYIPMSDVTTSGIEHAVDTATDPHKRGQYVPVPSELLRTLRNEAGLTMREAADAMGYSSKSSISNVENGEYETVKRDTLRRFREAYAATDANTRRLDQILREDVRFEEVVNVEETDRVEPTYDLEVQPNGRTIENFLGGKGGVFLSNTAGLCDPGYQGQITLELSNLGTAPVALSPGMRVSQLTFTELRSPAARPYGAERGSKYQDQDGPQASRIGDDPEFVGETGETDPGSENDATTADSSEGG
ncbi:dCTP deaminase domain-containing protein [Halorubrum vacuolatum]|uniref:dCTP deaminase domain-containing protein n=1 Tax=Halorubrum vacuolatum TaxID=63740 RepID=UPI0037420E05